ncbi:M15 family metallopeptidase [Sansalvadorimonas sp. 2012CJ34-2]|uniref:M15 family metallopeptidase n=1 Tax=Parendozoicomonas callyspongiae TaxID=2942213 RepID=A0ABT0PD70_9GAMM|nr:M15 family metallopeptidase [Sansalvadorimonas sp. 2012CJ34-2]MCL6269329.1 M15 family metallopeptidase [Sansalvadorimonas sp. 2012CJ34-2]
MKSVQKQAQFLIHVTQLLQKAYEASFIVTGGELYRTVEQQKLYVRQGRSKTMNSRHLQRLAIDLNFFIPDQEGKVRLTYEKSDLQAIGDYWESLHSDNKWGGNWKKFKDTPHFERR